MTDTVQGFIELFQGNQTAIGTEEGGCRRLDFEAFESLPNFIGMHLIGSYLPIGVYPMVPFSEMASDTEVETAWKVHWGCVDFDEGDEPSLVHARNVQAVLAEFGVTGWVERSRSKGFHLWVFAAEWVPAVVMRKALLGACQVVDAPQKEINPKQVTLGVDPEGRPKLGNYVRLPYPGGLNEDKVPTDARRVVLRWDGGPIHVDKWVLLALDGRVTADQLQVVGDTLYVEPAPRVRQVRPGGPMLGDPQMRLSPLAFKIWDEGPLEGAKRGHTLYKLACQIYEDGKHTAEEAEELLLDADERWGKFVDRGEPEYITKMVDKIWEDEG